MPAELAAELGDKIDWQKQWDALLAAPVPVGLFLAIGAAGAWWLRGTTMQSQIDALKERNGVMEERLKLAAEKLEEREAATAKLKEELNELREQIDAGATRQAIALTSQAATETLTSVTGFNDELRKVLMQMPPAPRLS